jgi:hypothetical protein
MAPKVEAAAAFADAGLTGTVIEPGVAAEKPAPPSGSAPMARAAVSSRMRT